MIIYLDQNKWVDLAKAHYGKTDDSDASNTLESVLRAAERGVRFPLSLTHYVETARIGDRGRRARLGEFMWSLSNGQTFASHKVILIHELEVALARRFPVVTPRPYALIGYGIGHAFGANMVDFTVPLAWQEGRSGEEVVFLKRAMEREMEKMTLTGRGPGGFEMSRHALSGAEAGFQAHLAEYAREMSGIPRTDRESAFLAADIAGIAGEIAEVIRYHGITESEFLALGQRGVAAFADELPSRRVVRQLYRQVSANPSLRPSPTDLSDWSGLGFAVAYCDIVVCEKHFANLVTRPGLDLRSTVLTDIAGMRSILN